MTIIDPGGGPDHQPFARRIHPDGNWRDPCPFRPDLFLVAADREMHLMDRQGQTRLLHTLDDPAADDAARTGSRPPTAARAAIPTAATGPKPTGQLVLSDVTAGATWRASAPGDIKKLLVLEQLPGPFHNSPGFDGISLWGRFTLTRILGTVPVEPDGSANFEVPAMRSLFLSPWTKTTWRSRRCRAL